MAENTKRSIFALNGLTGMFIAVVLLLSILVFLQIGVVTSYQDAVTKPYDAAPLRDINNLKAIDDRDTQREYTFQSPKSEK